MAKTSSDWQHLALADLETTGAMPTRDRITEIGVVEATEDGTVNEWRTLVNPETLIPGFIQSMTGITDAMVTDSPTFAELGGEVIERLGDRLPATAMAELGELALRQESEYSSRIDARYQVEVNFRSWPIPEAQVQLKINAIRIEHCNTGCPSRNPDYLIF
jgi:inhibitor of KinA sporulation pathway (predicted exonuclease)